MTDDSPAPDAPDTGVDAAAGDGVARDAAAADRAETDRDGVTDRPSDRTTDRRSISSRVRVIWGLRMLVGVVVLTGIVTAVASFVSELPILTGPAFGLLAVVLGVAWVHRRWQVWVYEVRTDSLYLERGVVTHVRTIAPFVRIQHVDTQRGPLERWLGLSTLVVYTAGTRGADVSIPGLTPAEARDLQARVKELAIEAEGGDAV